MFNDDDSDFPITNTRSDYCIKSALYNFITLAHL